MNKKFFQKRNFDAFTMQQVKNLESLIGGEKKHETYHCTRCGQCPPGYRRDSNGNCVRIKVKRQSSSSKG